DSLVRVTPKGEIIPWLAEKWTTSSDGKAVTFNLRQGVKYQDGSVFDAASVKWNIERYKTGKGSSRTGDLALVDTLEVLDKIIVKPILDADVRLTNLRTGNAQVINLINGKDVAAVKADPTLTYLEVGSFAWNSLVPNEASGFIFSDHRLVKAVAMALDREEILQKGPAQGVGLVGWGPISPAHFAFDANFKPWPKADPEGAKALIAQALGAGKKLQF